MVVDKSYSEELMEKLEEQVNNNVLLMERLAEIELQLEDREYIKLDGSSDSDFSRDGVRSMAKQVRLGYFANPLINHAIRMQSDYVFAQGVDIGVVGKDAEEGRKKALKWWNDPRNKREIFGHRARLKRERDLQTYGNVFIAVPNDPDRNYVRVVPTDEISDIICNPDDSHEVWFYIRKWTRRSINGNELEKRIEAYPDVYLELAGVEIPDILGEGNKTIPVIKDRVMYHVIGDDVGDMKFGTPEVWNAVPWAKAVREDLMTYATVRKSLARFAWKMTGVRGGQSAFNVVKTKLETTIGTDGRRETNPPPTTASTLITDGNRNMDPIKTAGMQPTPDEGRRLWLMTGAGVGFPETMLSGDANVGNLATAKSLDRPTEFKMVNRQKLWADTYKDIFTYMLEKSGVDMDDTYVDVSFPSILEHDALERVRAVVTAITLNGRSAARLFDRDTILRMLLTALGENDVDGMIAKLTNLSPEEIADLETIAPDSDNVIPPGGRPQRLAN